MKNKKGQFYIIAAVILIVVMLGLLTKTNVIRVKPQPGSYPELSKNFEQEAARIIDSGIHQGKSEEQIQTDLREFTETFTEYAAEKEPNIGFLYIFGNKESITVANFLVQQAEVTIGEISSTAAGGNALTLNKIQLEVGGEQFVRDLYTKATVFQGVNVATGSGEWVKVNIGGIPYKVKIAESIDFNSLVIECSEGQCFVKLGE